jgi:hypothetical protein
MLILPMPFGAFQPPKPAPGGPATVFPWGREQELLASCLAGGYLYILRPRAIKARVTRSICERSAQSL